MTKANCYTLDPKTHRYELGTPNPPETPMSEQETQTEPVDLIGLKKLSGSAKAIADIIADMPWAVADLKAMLDEEERPDVKSLTQNARLSVAAKLQRIVKAKMKEASEVPTDDLEAAMNKRDANDPDEAPPTEDAIEAALDLNQEGIRTQRERHVVKIMAAIPVQHWANMQETQEIVSRLRALRDTMRDELVEQLENPYDKPVAPEDQKVFKRLKSILNEETNTIEEATRAADDAVAKAHAYEEMLKREEPALFKNHPSPWGLEYRQEAERRIAEGVSELGRDD